MKNKRAKTPKINLHKTSKVANFIYKFKSMSIIKHILIIYLFITLIGSLLLLAPLAHNAGATNKPSYLDDLFTAASAFSDTGLVTKATFVTWSSFGQAIIAIMIMVGGLGFFALKVYMFNIILGRPISFATRNALSAERGSTTIGSTHKIIKVAITVMLIIVAMGSIILSVYFYFHGENPSASKLSDMHNEYGKFDDSTISPQGNWATSIRFGIFHTISGLNNAGFDIIGGHSLAPYYHNYGLQAIFIILFVLGGIGYPVIYDLYKWVKTRFTGEKFIWSLFTKVSMVAYLAIAIIGITFTFTIELTAHDYTYGATTGSHITHSFWNDPTNGSITDRGMALFFNAMSTRNAGFATIDVHQLSSGTLVLFSVLMFIGSAPSSTAGGIRTTTIAIVLLGIWSRIRGRTWVRAFNRKIHSDTITRSFVVFVVAVIIVAFGVLVGISSFAEHGGKINTPGNNWNHPSLAGHSEHFTATELVFEVASAFGTTGLSAGITPMLSTGTLITLIFIMFIGQLGVSPTILLWGSKKSSKREFRYVKQDIAIG